MKYIANIVTKSNAYKFNSFIKICKNYFEVDKTIPTLIVGVENVNIFVSEGYNNKRPDYVFRQIDNNVFWTFSTMEKRSDNEHDVEKFKKHIIKELKTKINYTFLNILTFSKTRMKDFVSFLKSGRGDICYYVTDTMLYIAFDDKVWGVSLDDCEYIGVKKEKIINKIKKVTDNIISDKRFLTENDKNFFQNDEILMAAMFSYARS